MIKPSIFQRVGRRFGIEHRGAYLIMSGVIWLMIALTILVDPGPNRPELFHTQLPIWFRVSVWSVVGVISIVCALPRLCRWQWVGFAVLGIPPMERAVSYALGAVAVYQDGGVWTPNASGFLVWLAVLGTIRLVASWPDPSVTESKWASKAG